MGQANPIELLQQLFDYLAAGDWTSYRAMLADGAIYDEDATGRHCEGIDQILEVVQAWKRAFPDMTATIKTAFPSGDSLVAELEWQGTLSGPLEGPFGQLPATGKSGRLAAVQLIKFDGERIREIRHYFDLMTLLREVGLAVSPEAQPSP